MAETVSFRGHTANLGNYDKDSCAARLRWPRIHTDLIHSRDQQSFLYALIKKETFSHALIVHETSRKKEDKIRKT